MINMLSAFNAVFGIKTNFAAVDVISNTGVNLGVDGRSFSTLLFLRLHHVTVYRNRLRLENPLNLTNQS